MRLVLPIVCFLALTACQDRIICSAFQSTYILDDSTRMAYYSSYWRLDKSTQEKFLASYQPAVDSLDTAAVGGIAGDITLYYDHVQQYLTPQRNPRRSKYGVVKYEPEWMKNYKLKSAPMENVLAPQKEKPVSEKEKELEIGDFVAMNEDDSTVVLDSAFLASEDSLLVAPVDSSMLALEEEEEPKGPEYLYGYDPSDNFNVEQEYYNKYFGEYLLAPKKKKQPSVVATDSTQVAGVENLSADSVQVEEEGGMFRRRRNQDPANDNSVEGEVPAQEGNEEGENNEGNKGNGNGN